jgi:hypothetical protein
VTKESPIGSDNAFKASHGFIVLFNRLQMIIRYLVSLERGRRMLMEGNISFNIPVVR